jgi:glucose-6-phosphate 1-dehydrogenase
MPGNRSVPAQQATQSPSRPSPADPCAMVIFGATGDLTKRPVIPALDNLARIKVLSERFVLIGVSRSVGTVEDWRNHLHDTLKSFVGNTTTGFDIDHIDGAAWKQLDNRSWRSIDGTDAGTSS